MRGRKPYRFAPYACLECGKRMSVRQAERASDEGCVQCGGVDIDLATPNEKGAQRIAFRDYQTSYEAEV